MNKSMDKNNLNYSPPSGWPMRRLSGSQFLTKFRFPTNQPFFHNMDNFIGQSPARPMQWLHSDELDDISNSHIKAIENIIRRQISVIVNDDQYHVVNEEFFNTIRSRADKQVQSRMRGIMIMCGISVALSTGALCLCFIKR